jgi:hypothetical protein
MNELRGHCDHRLIGLIITGALNVLSSLILIVGRLVSLIKGPDRVITDEDRRLGYMFAALPDMC